MCSKSDRSERCYQYAVEVQEMSHSKGVGSRDWKRSTRAADTEAATAFWMVKESLTYQGKNLDEFSADISTTKQLWIHTQRRTDICSVSPSNIFRFLTPSPCSWHYGGARIETFQISGIFPLGAAKKLFFLSEKISLQNRVRTSLRWLGLPLVRPSDGTRGGGGGGGGGTEKRSSAETTISGTTVHADGRGGNRLSLEWLFFFWSSPNLLTWAVSEFEGEPSLTNFVFFGAICGLTSRECPAIRGTPTGLGARRKGGRGEGRRSLANSGRVGWLEIGWAGIRRFPLMSRSGLTVTMPLSGSHPVCWMCLHIELKLASFIVWRRYWIASKFEADDSIMALFRYRCGVPTYAPERARCCIIVRAIRHVIIQSLSRRVWCIPGFRTSALKFRAGSIRWTCSFELIFHTDSSFIVVQFLRQEFREEVNRSVLVLASHSKAVFRRPYTLAR